MLTFSIFSVAAVVICAIVMMATLWLSGLLFGRGRIGVSLIALAIAALALAVGLDVSVRLSLVVVPNPVYAIAYVVFVALATLGVLLTLGGGSLPRRKQGAKTT